MHPKVKICGMKNAETIKTAIDHKVDFLGFVFYPDSPRNLTPKQATILTKDIPSHIGKVAVLVNETDQFIEYIKNDFDYFDNFFIKFLSYLFNPFYIFIAVQLKVIKIIFNIFYKLICLIY